MSIAQPVRHALARSLPGEQMAAVTTPTATITKAPWRRWSDLMNLFDLVREEWPADPAGNEREILNDLLGDVRIV
jgi:hypothetical protein